MQSIITIKNDVIPPIKHITAVEIKERQDKRLCYYCKEKYVVSHKCKKKQIHLLKVEEL